MDESEFHVAVQDLLVNVLLTDDDLEKGVDLRQMKTLTAYTEYGLSKAYQSQRKLWRIQSAGGSAAAQQAAQDVSEMLRMDDTIKTILNPSIIRLAGKL